MRHLDEYRDPAGVRWLLQEIESRLSQDWTLMEVCGGQTHALLRFGLDELLPPRVHLIHGPGCPVCVTPQERINAALSIAAQPGVIFCSFGDMLRVPGSRADLLRIKAGGGDVRIVYSPLDALEIARANPSRQVVFFAVGFETTAPASAMAAWRAKRDGIGNFSLLVAHVRVPPALEMLLSDPECRIQGLLAPGHVCTITGWSDYRRIASEYRVPVVVTGFEPLDLLHGVLAAVVQLEAGRHDAENQYARVVQIDGNRDARRLMEEVFVVADREWRGLGWIPNSGCELSPPYAHLDALRRFPVEESRRSNETECMSGQVLQGKIRPTQCPHFGARCTPDTPMGATMVSSEGACAAYFAYGREPVALTQNGTTIRAESCDGG